MTESPSWAERPWEEKVDPQVEREQEDLARAKSIKSKRNRRISIFVSIILFMALLFGCSYMAANAPENPCLDAKNALSLAENRTGTDRAAALYTAAVKQAECDAQK